jgi:hypothetical protein
MLAEQREVVEKNFVGPGRNYRWCDPSLDSLHVVI